MAKRVNSLEEAIEDFSHINGDIGTSPLFNAIMDYMYNISDEAKQALIARYDNAGWPEIAQYVKQIMKSERPFSYDVTIYVDNVHIRQQMLANGHQNIWAGAFEDIK